MQCNIDGRGVRFRRVWGAMNVMVGVVLAGLGLWSGIWWVWILAGACLLAGGFAIYESRKKWCVLRAMGVKTKV
jgi:hypothetical protein